MQAVSFPASASRHMPWSFSIRMRPVHLSRQKPGPWTLKEWSHALVTFLIWQSEEQGGRACHGTLMPHSPHRTSLLWLFLKPFQFQEQKSWGLLLRKISLSHGWNKAFQMRAATPIEREPDPKLTELSVFPLTLSSFHHKLPKRAPSCVTDAQTHAASALVRQRAHFTAPGPNPVATECSTMSRNTWSTEVK